MKVDKWIQGAKTTKHKGALHRQLGFPTGKKLPTGLLEKIEDAPLGSKVKGHKVTRLLKDRSIFALNVRKR